MPTFDLGLDELRRYQPELTRQHDFNAFWNRALQSLRREPVSVNLSVKATPFRGMDTYEVNYLGSGNALITGDLLVPHGVSDAPGVVVYHGYASRRWPVYSVLHWAAMGAVVLNVDVRGQRGQASDTAAYAGPRAPGFLTAGVDDPRGHYYRNVYLDCVRALDVLADREEVDTARLAVTGVSQGGGLSLAVAALDPRVALCMAHVPFLCAFPRAARLAEQGPYTEITRFCSEADEQEISRVFQTLSYFDNVNLAGRIEARTLIDVGLCDTVCPPSTVFAVYNHLACEKRIEVYPYMTHWMNPAFEALCMEEMAREFGMQQGPDADG